MNLQTDRLECAWKDFDLWSRKRQLDLDDMIKSPDRLNLVLTDYIQRLFGSNQAETVLEFLDRTHLHLSPASL